VGDLDHKDEPIIHEFDSPLIYVLYILIYVNDVFILTGIFTNILVYIFKDLSRTDIVVKEITKLINSSLPSAKLKRKYKKEDVR